MNENIIIFEGIDGSGKSTLIDQFIRENPEYKVFHCTRNTKNTFKFFRNFYSKIIVENDHYVFDRSHIGQFIYQNSDERRINNWMSLRDLCDLEEFINSHRENFSINWVQCDLNTCYYNCLQDSDDMTYSYDYVESLFKRYEYFFNNISSTDFNVIENDYTVSEDPRDFDYSSLPEIISVDFDGCLVTDTFPDISTARVNESLLNRLKDHQKNGGKVILWTCRTGDSLDEACDFLERHDFHPDAVNDNIEEVKLKLNGGPRKVYCHLYIDDKAEKVEFTGC